MAYTYYPRWHRRGGEYRRVRAYPTGLGQQRARASFLLTFLPPASVEYSKGSSDWGRVSVRDSTLAFTEDGCIALVPTADIYASGAWQKDTIDGDSKYWLRLTADAVMTSAEVREVYVSPYRPALHATEFPRSGQMLASVLPKVIVGSWRGEELVWHDVWTLEAAKVMKLLIGRTTGSESIGRVTLWAVAQDDVYHMAIGPEADPVRAAWPPTHSGTMHAWALSGQHMGLPVNIKSVQKLAVYGEYLQGDDELWVFWRWDNDDQWYSSGPHTPSPVILDDLDGRGRVLYVVAAIRDASRDAIAPYISYVEIPEGGWTDEGPLAEALGSDISSPQST